ncbi:MAG: hypothetical protein KAS32_12350 [Candidatus Peribacteraceae bacterium]|nr:hypothetical protein [Candidatus Peribacteraceae bacterium]
MTLNDLRIHFNSINILQLLDECILETEEILIGLVRSQIEGGFAGNNQLPPYKSDRYSVLKQKKGSKAPFGITDLKFHGNFLDKLKVKIFSKNLLIRSTDVKKSIILSKYGPEIYILNDENLSYYVNEVLQPLLLKKVKP